jgi:hypothetical protein
LSLRRIAPAFPPCKVENDDAAVHSLILAGLVSSQRRFSHFPPIFATQKRQPNAMLPSSRRHNGDNFLNFVKLNEFCNLLAERQLPL